jgi:hypothetical protein
VTRGLRAALAGCLLSGALLLLSAGRTWANVSYPDRSRPVTGRALVGSLATWGVVALAGVVAVAATKRRGRLAVGVALVASGATAAALCAGAIRDADLRTLDLAILRRVPVAPTGVHLTAWPWVALGAGALLAATGILVAARGPRWAALGARYGAPAERPAADPDLWAALDRGEDPTA